MIAETTTDTIPETFVSTLKRDGCTESFVTVPAACHEEPERMFERMDKCLRELNATIAKMDSIGLISSSGVASFEQPYCVNCNNCLLGNSSSRAMTRCPVNALFAHTVSGTNVSPVWLGGKIVGTTYEDAHARYCLLNDVIPDYSELPGRQVTQVLEFSESALESLDMSFGNVVRTWFHVDEIFKWYDLFNQARGEFFKKRGVYDRLVPASTGVGGSNSQGTAVVGNLLAVKPKSGGVTIKMVPSPLQHSALDYGSSFSRAVELETPDHKRLFISGTASIAMDGGSLHLGDIDKQVERTMDVVVAILESRGMDWSDVSRAIGYVKDKSDLLSFSRHCTKRGIPSAPAVIVQNDVCREDLLFELELDAIQSK